MRRWSPGNTCSHNRDSQGSVIITCCIPFSLFITAAAWKINSTFSPQNPAIKIFDCFCVPRASNSLLGVCLTLSAWFRCFDDSIFLQFMFTVYGMIFSQTQNILEDWLAVGLSASLCVCSSPCQNGLKHKKTSLTHNCAHLRSNNNKNNKLLNFAP